MDMAKTGICLRNGWEITTEEMSEDGCEIVVTQNPDIAIRPARIAEE